jgi:uncharacterized membrane protein
MTNETRARSLAKTLAYRIVAIVLLAAVTYAFTGNPGETTLVTVVFNVLGAGAYYLLERLWNGIGWGRKPEVMSTSTKTLVRTQTTPTPTRQALEQQQEQPSKPNQ